ncbi:MULTISPECIES: hypothetical protein [unclassified Haloarcula]|uniref:hypothetical protein n=1 Tax=unclassified Haloarcula TaxID=2624677 RepID=UPI000AEEAD63|nr:MULTISPECIES: hypothetical protein [unclassified Haloarcula]
MGPYDHRTQEAWKELNKKFGTCPNCGTEPFEGYSALKSYSSPITVLGAVLAALTTNNIISIIPATSKAIDFGDYIRRAFNSESTSWARISEAVVGGSADISNVKILGGKFICNSCEEIWHPDEVEMSLTELGLTAYKY